MKTLNILVFGLVSLLATTLILAAGSPEMVGMLADNSIALIFAFGILGLVGAREKTPAPQA
jgi:hypothetical protein